MSHRHRGGKVPRTKGVRSRRYGCEVHHDLLSEASPHRPQRLPGTSASALFPGPLCALLRLQDGRVDHDLLPGHRLALHHHGRLLRARRTPRRGRTEDGAQGLAGRGRTGGQRRAGIPGAGDRIRRRAPDHDRFPQPLASPADADLHDQQPPHAGDRPQVPRQAGMRHAARRPAGSKCRGPISSA